MCQSSCQRPGKYGYYVLFLTVELFINQFTGLLEVTGRWLADRQHDTPSLGVASVRDMG